MEDRRQEDPQRRRQSLAALLGIVHVERPDVRRQGRAFHLGVLEPEQQLPRRRLPMRRGAEARQVEPLCGVFNLRHLASEDQGVLALDVGDLHRGVLLPRCHERAARMALRATLRRALAPEIRQDRQGHVGAALDRLRHGRRLAAGGSHAMERPQRRDKVLHVGRERLAGVGVDATLDGLRRRGEVYQHDT